MAEGENPAANSLGAVLRGRMMPARKLANKRISQLFAYLTRE